ncbi:site-specific integrase [Sporosarcina obsidiansis]|uniref:site-specific integrase n=1 Tax=Sporosarcina obsidiansis TaxID=2660748 RepID=UPI00129BFEAB|nr:site-specific integrase [Sporosarcina obsidiansis]
MKFVEPIRDVEKIEEMKNYLKSTSGRNYLLFVFGIYSTLRISDILSLKKKDVLGERLILVEKKTTKVKEILISPRLRRELKPYIKDLEDDDYLFSSRKGENKPISRTTAYRVLRSAGEACGLDRIGTHSMRKTFGYHFYERTKNIALLQELYGHSSEEITKRYIGINQDILDKAIRNFDY